MQITITMKLDKLSFKIGKTNNIEINIGNNFNEIFFIFDDGKNISLLGQVIFGMLLKTIFCQLKSQKINKNEFKFL